MVVADGHRVPPLLLLWSSHWSLAYLCHLSVSLRSRAKTSSHLTLSFLISAPLLSLVEGDGQLIFSKRKRQISLFLQPVDFTSSFYSCRRSPNLLSELTPPPSHFFCSPCSDLLLNNVLLLILHPKRTDQRACGGRIDAKAVSNSALLL